MSISAIASQSPAAPIQDPNRQSFGQLVTALRSGNLSAAQSAYSAFAQVAPGQGGGPFSQIGDALQSGDIGKAQQALASLQQQMQATKGAHHHHGHRQDSDGDKSQSTTAPTGATTAPPNSSTSTNAVDVTA